MRTKPELTIDEGADDGVRQVAGPRRISDLEDLVRPPAVRHELFGEYRAMAADRERESDALRWAEATCGDAIQEAV